MDIKMIQDRLGTEDGFAVGLFRAGEIYRDVAPRLARFFLRRGYAVQVSPAEGVAA